MTPTVGAYEAEGVLDQTPPLCPLVAVRELVSALVLQFADNLLAKYLTPPLTRTWRLAVSLK